MSMELDWVKIDSKPNKFIAEYNSRIIEIYEVSRVTREEESICDWYNFQITSLDGTLLYFDYMNDYYTFEETANASINWIDKYNNR